MEAASDRALLSEANGHLFDRIMRKSNDGYEYHNPYVREGGYTFICPVRKTDSRRIVPYYVSREHDVNTVVGGLPIAGRFVYTDSYRLQAIAEEPATGSVLGSKTGLIAEYKYMKRRQFNAMWEGSPNTDPVCGLTPGFKLRLCVSLFASDELRHLYKFSASMEDVEDCRKIRVSFLAQTQARFIFSISWKFFDKNRIYEEEMMACKTVRIENNVKVTHYVSRGFAKNSVITFKEKFDDAEYLSGSILRMLA